MLECVCRRQVEAQDAARTLLAQNYTFFFNYAAQYYEQNDTTYSQWLHSVVLFNRDDGGVYSDELVGSAPPALRPAATRPVCTRVHAAAARALLV